MQKFKTEQKITKIENQPKTYSSYFLSILACTMVFNTSKKFPSLADYMVKRTFCNIHI